MNMRSVLLAATILALPMAVQAAEPVSGVYVSGGLGFDYLNTLDAKQYVAPVLKGEGVNITGGNAQSHGGWVGLGAVGYGLGNGVRVEVEGNFRQNRSVREQYNLRRGRWRHLPAVRRDGEWPV